MKPAIRLACLAALPLALVACQGEKKAQHGTAEGEILPGSASDAMLPYDAVRSQPPLAPLPSATGKATRKTDSEETGDGSATDDAGNAGTPTGAPESTAPEPVAP